MKKTTMKRAQRRGDSRFARVLTFVAVMLLAMATGAWADEWTNIVVNSDMEGTDVSCFYVQENGLGSENIYLAHITDGIGKEIAGNPSRAIKVQTTGEESAGYETQFDIRLPYELPAGTKYRLSFDYKSDKAAVREDYYDDATDYSFGFQVSNEPGQYVWWTLGGWPAPYFETTEDNVNKWQHYEAEYTVPGDCNGSQSSDGDWLLNFQTIYIQLAKNKVATEFIIDNIKVEIDATVLAGLTEQPVTDPKLLVAYPLPITGVVASQDPANTSDNWCTYYNPTTNVKVNTAGVQIFKAAVSGETLALTQVAGNIIKAGQGVVLKSPVGGELDMVETTDAAAGDYSGNELKGTTEAINGNGKIYVLNYTQENGVGFYQLSDNGTLAANKAYLEYNGGNNARRFFSFGFEETTSIDQVSSSKIQVSGSDVYDLQGRQVKQPTRGLYIKNGKKVVIK